eukprot:symbB.v1.2.034852.t1/scaffold4567.1/size37893/4
MPFAGLSTPATWLAEKSLLSVGNGMCILVKKVFLPSISLSVRPLHQSSEEANRSKKDRRNKCRQPVVVCSDEEGAKEKNMTSDSAATEKQKEVEVASSSGGSRDGQPSEDVLTKKVVAEMMGHMSNMIKMMKKMETGENEVKKADAEVEPVEGDLYPVM